jgi:uncharacterized SAM-dependent methyltransferase
MQPGSPFDLIELGAGDCKKSAYLLRHLVRAGAGFTYIPIDISSNIINHLQTHLPAKIAGLKVRGYNGEYLPMITEAACKSYLISLADQEVTLWCDDAAQRISFARDEEIFMEISQKYTIDQVDHLARKAFFKPEQRFYDDRGWFVDALWCAV